MNLFDPDYLIHTANVLLLVAFAVRDVLLLRSLFVAGSFFALGFYYYQAPPLWSAIAWTALYIVIHAFWIVRILLERRPIVLTPDEETLYRLAFGSLDRRKFARFAGLGEWRNAEKGQQLLREGESLREVYALTSGSVAARMGDDFISSLKPGQLIGTGGALIDGLAPFDFVFEAPGRYLALPLAEAQAFLEKDPELRLQIRLIISTDLAEKGLQYFRGQRQSSSSQSGSVSEY